MTIYQKVAVALVIIQLLALIVVSLWAIRNNRVKGNPYAFVMDEGHKGYSCSEFCTTNEAPQCPEEDLEYARRKSDLQ